MRRLRTAPTGRRKLQRVETMPLVGGRLCLDLANTTGARASTEPRERLRTYHDVLTWSERAGLLTPGEVRTLASRSAVQTRDAAAAVKRLCDVREILYRLLLAAAERRSPSKADVDQFNRLWREDRSRRMVVPVGHALEVRLSGSPRELDRMIWPVVESAADLLTSDAVARLKRCGECDWLFLDDSKNRSRTWCKKACGDRVRARRHYGRVRQLNQPARERGRP